MYQRSKVMLYNSVKTMTLTVLTSRFLIELGNGLKKLNYILSIIIIITNLINLTCYVHRVQCYVNRYITTFLYPQNNRRER